MLYGYPEGSLKEIRTAAKKSRPFEQYQLSCIERRPMGAALIFYLSNFNIAWIFITETNAEISNRDASLWDVFLICLPARLVLPARAGF